MSPPKVIFLLNQLLQKTVIPRKDMVKIVIFAIQLFFFAGVSLAQSLTDSRTAITVASDTVTVKTRLEELFSYVRADDYEHAAPYILYCGSDTARKWEDSYNYANPKDRKEIEIFCKRIKRFLERAGTTYSYQIFMVDPYWYAWNLSYDLNGNRPMIAFAFRKINGKFYLGAMNES
jgi:hypothetical protein